MYNFKQFIKRFLEERHDEYVYERNGRLYELSRMTTDEVLMNSDQARWTTSRWIKLDRRILLIELMLVKIGS